VAAGTDQSFSLTLRPGSFQTICPGGAKFHEGTLEVAAGASGAAADQAERTKAVDAYLTYVKGEADQLITAVAPFVAAVKAGDMGKAKTLFAASRYHYETIEPIPESFGDLDPAVDAREGDVPEAEWGGFHRLEKALWAEQSVKTMGPVADKLEADIRRLRSQIDSVELEPATIANGAVELLNEVSKSKITGEEERYSGTDLVDFEANVQGAEAAYDAVKPIVEKKNAKLVTELDAKFAAVYAALRPYKTGDTTYVAYTDLTRNDTKALSQAIDSLAEPLSKVSKQVVGS
jgi:iron uptake system component EfeO